MALLGLFPEIVLFKIVVEPGSVPVRGLAKIAAAGPTFPEIVQAEIISVAPLLAMPPPQSKLRSRLLFVTAQFRRVNVVVPLPTAMPPPSPPCDRPCVNVSPDIVLVPATTQSTRVASPPLMVSASAPGPLIVKDFARYRLPLELASVMVPVSPE